MPIKNMRDPRGTSHSRLNTGADWLAVRNV